MLFLWSITIYNIAIVEQRISVHLYPKVHAANVSKSLRRTSFFFARLLMYISIGNVIKQLVHAFSCALSSYGALGKFKEYSRS